MRVTTGWYGNEYFVVKPLHNGCRQELIMTTWAKGGGRYSISAGVFSCSTTYESFNRSSAWINPTSTNKKPSIETLTVALEALTEIEEEIRRTANGKRRWVYVDGMDARRLRVYTKVLTKKCGYKKSKKISTFCGLPLVFKQI